MTVSHGIVCNGTVIPGTEWVLRDSDAWWDWLSPTDRPDLRARGGRLATLLVGHWTGGNARTGPTSGQRVVRAMKGRLRDDGSLMDVSIHFVIGWDGMVWQTCDLAYATVHVGRQVNERSIGVETCWPGTWSQAERLQVQGAKEIRRVRGKSIECLKPSDELIDAWVRLAKTLSPIGTPLVSGVVDIPRELGMATMPKFGVGEHWMAEKTTKVDAAGYLLDALRSEGWR